jgi:Flp pilus assembly protein TadD
MMREYSEIVIRSIRDLIQKGEIKNAKKIIKKYLALDYKNSDMHNLMGITYALEKDFNEAIKSFEKATKIDKNFIEPTINTAAAHIEIKEYQKAIQILKKIDSQQNENSSTKMLLGIALRRLGNMSQAIEVFTEILNISPNNIEALSNRGISNADSGNYSLAHEDYLKALQINSGYSEANHNLAHIYLAEMNFLEGWKQYEWRWKTREFNSAPITTSKPIWNGKDFAVRLYVWAEQGLGDQILYASMFHQLRSSVQTLIVGVDQKLLILFRRSFPNIEFLDKNFAVSEENYDAHIPIGSLGQFFRRDKKDFETVKYPYLTVCDEKYQSLKKKLVQPSLKLVGLSWLSKNEKIGSFKSIQLSELLPILTVSNTKFIDLQYTDTASEREQLRKEYGIDIEKINSIDNFNDIDGLAALIMCCDMVITTSNTTAHLAGAIGKKVILLLPFSKGRFWYWHHENKQSLWYPSVTVNEQLKMDDWLEVIQVVANNIKSEQ